MTRLHVPTLEAIASTVGDRYHLTSPSPGWFVPASVDHELVTPGRLLGILTVLGRATRIVAPVVQGGIVKPPHGRNESRAVSYGDVIAVVDPSELPAMAAGGVATTPATAVAAHGIVFRAPTSGRFYGRSSPDKPAFVTVGDELVRGATVCLLEVMKTFHRVTYGGSGLPERATVTGVLVTDGADVTAGDPLLALDPR